MACERWTEAIIETVCDEIEPARRAELTAHVESCGSCRTTLDELERTHVVLRENEPEIPGVPRVVVLRDTSRYRPALLAASIVGAALLAGAGAGAGYGLGRNVAATDRANELSATARTTVDAATAELVRHEVERRMSALESSAEAARTRAEPAPASPTTRRMSEDELRAALARLERKINGSRAADLDYLLAEIAASEVRTSNRIGQTNQALRYVALASNPNVSER